MLGAGRASACSLAWLETVVVFANVVFRECSILEVNYFRRLSTFLSSDFVHKTFQVLLSSRLQNQHAHARWRLIHAHALA
jgi:hypothetical protein